MEKIDLKKIIDRHKLETPEVAKHLFPKNNYPISALKRVLKGEAFLDSNQLSKLALLCNIKIHELWGRDWRVKDNKRKGLITLIADTYKAELNIGNWVTKIYANDKLIHEAVLFPKEVTLSRFMDVLSNIVEEYEEPLI